MAKNKDKGIRGVLDSFVNPQLLNKKERKAAERYGINPSGYAFNRPGGGGIQKKDPRRFNSDVAKAAMNDYDTRRTMEAAAMSGNKKAEKYAKSGFKNLKDVTKANNIMRRMHGKAGNGGDFSSASDFAGLTFNQVNKDRNKLMESIEGQSASAIDDDPSSQQVTRNEGPVTFSKEYAQSRAGEDAYKDFTAGWWIFSTDAWRKRCG